MQQDELLETCKKAVLAGKEYHEIKATLERQGLPSKQIKAAMKQTDEWIAAYQLAQQTKEKHLVLALVGTTLMLIGLLIFLLSDGRVVSIGIILVGAWFAKKGYQQYQLPSNLSMRVKEKRKGKFERF